MIKVLHVVGRMNRGGVETLLMNIYRNIDRSKYKFYFLCYGYDHYDYEDEIYQLNGEIIRLPEPRNPITIIKQIENVLRTYGIQIVHSHTYYNSAYVMIAAMKYGIKARITHSHSTKDNKPQTLKRKIYGISCKFLINRFTNYFCACGVEAGKSLFERRKKIKLIHNGIDLNRFKYNPSIRKIIRNELVVDDDTVVIGHAGRFNMEKNHKFIINIYTKIYMKNPNSRLLLIGDGELLEEIKQEVKNLNLDCNVVFLGSISNVNDYYNAMDVFVLPSLYEGLGIVAIEAQASALKVLVSDTIPEEVNITGSVDFLPISSGSETVWVDKIEEVKHTPRNSVGTGIELYDINSVCNDLDNWYSSMVEGEKIYE